jgi:CHAT domain-containing protein
MRRHALEPNKNFDALAFQVNEQARARGLMNLLAESNVDIRQGIDAKLLEREDESKKLLASRLEDLSDAFSGKAKPERIATLKREIESVRASYEQIKTQIRAASPRYMALTQPKTLSLKEIQSEVLDADSVLLEYALGETKSYLWIVTKTGFRSVELPAKDAIDRTARQFYESLTARNKRVKFETREERDARIVQADSDLDKFSGEMSRMILAPAASFLANKRLLIVADGTLQYVPFAALSMKNGFLIETNEIVSLPSASVLALLRSETSGRQPASKTLAVLADPIFDKKDERFQTIANKTNRDQKLENSIQSIVLTKKQTRAAGDSDNELDFARLPFTRREADLISSVIPEGQKERWLDFAANRRSATSSQLSHFRFVHIATHGFINDQNPELSGLVFSTIDEDGREQDGFLRVGDIFNLKLPAEMVVLSGCRTGLGKEIKGEGLVGMTRAFMYAGAKRVTVSLWDINDEATSELMSHFYREMFGPKKRSPASALRQAQNAMIKDKRWNNPYFWATFVLQGESK